MDENLPVVEVDDNYSKSFSQEFYWLAKVCFYILGVPKNLCPVCVVAVEET